MIEGVYESGTYISSISSLTGTYISSISSLTGTYISSISSGADLGKGTYLRVRCCFLGTQT